MQVFFLVKLQAGNFTKKENPPLLFTWKVWKISYENYSVVAHFLVGIDCSATALEFFLTLFDFMAQICLIFTQNIDNLKRKTAQDCSHWPYVR